MPSSFPAGSSKHQGLGLWALGRRQTTKVTAWTILCTPPLGARGWVSAQKFSGQTPPQHHLAPGRRLHLPRTCWEDESHQLAESGVSRAIPPPPGLPQSSAWFRSYRAGTGKRDQDSVLKYLFCCKQKLLLAPASHIWAKRWQAPGWVVGATYQRGLRLGVLPGPRRGWVVHEQIEGGVDGVFVHAAGALRGLQAWKNHSWVRLTSRMAQAEGWLAAL